MPLHHLMINILSSDGVRVKTGMVCGKENDVIEKI